MDYQVGSILNTGHTVLNNSGNSYILSNGKEISYINKAKLENSNFVWQEHILDCCPNCQGSLYSSYYFDEELGYFCSEDCFNTFKESSYEMNIYEDVEPTEITVSYKYQGHNYLLFKVFFKDNQIILNSFDFSHKEEKEFLDNLFSDKAEKVFHSEPVMFSREDYVFETSIYEHDIFYSNMSSILKNLKKYFENKNFLFEISELI